MSYNFFIIGGDMRMFYLAKELVNDGNSVKILGFEKIGYDLLLNNNIKMAHSIDEAKKEEILISSIPLTLDEKTVYAPYSEKEIPLNDLKNKKIIAGKIPKGIKGNDILDDEITTIKNVIPTTEGAIAKAIEETEITLNDSNILILGYGRIGKMLCDRLKGFNANIYCLARKEEALTWIEANGYNPISVEELDRNLCKMKIIFNTIPKMVLDKSKLILLKKDTLIIDLASGKGGVDFESAKKMNIKFIHYLGIPGKIAPKTVAKYIKKYVYSVVEKKI